MIFYGGSARRPAGRNWSRSLTLPWPAPVPTPPGGAAGGPAANDDSRPKKRRGDESDDSDDGRRSSIAAITSRRDQPWRDLDSGRVTPPSVADWD